MSPATWVQPQFGSTVGIRVLGSTYIGSTSVCFNSRHRSSTEACSMCRCRLGPVAGVLGSTEIQPQFGSTAGIGVLGSTYIDSTAVCFNSSQWSCTNVQVSVRFSHRSVGRFNRSLVQQQALECWVQPQVQECRSVEWGPGVGVQECWVRARCRSAGVLGEGQVQECRSVGWGPGAGL